MKRDVTIYIAASVLVLLFILTGVEKVVDFQAFREKMSGQVFGPWLLAVLTYMVPLSEIACVMLLLFPYTRFAGFILSTAMLAAFTVYIILVLLNVFAKHPCPCGGPLKHLTWGQHLIFNTIFLLISSLGLLLTYKERRTENFA
ncbi:MauE/DoxX family redox-associated membrane protein [Pedobacter mucosus]|uniref:MauE/DoxX family redox-associated membrane protein n=1 Tax=Pedobacter mucosus TaxID=2895286 RepID=UPI001EE3FC6F|nr:MauE/DoxX family redox-associated membrane protein [Pedobacter mucosus]UKT65050.1 hypothetical protein LOK61_04550 [Pedobacter mucosus]